MRAPERLLQAVALSVPPQRRARFREEWRADLEGARSSGLSPWDLLAAAMRVAALLLWLHLRAEVHRSRSRCEVVGVGVGLGLLIAVTDLQVTALVPFVVVVLTLWVWWRIGRWIESGR